VTRPQKLAAIVRELHRALSRGHGQFDYKTREEIPEGLLRDAGISLAREGISARFARRGPRLLRVDLAPILA
jgi:hypothetical protein